MTDPAALRSAAVRLRWAADALRAECRRLDRTGTWLAADWRGTAAGTALAHLRTLASGFRDLAQVHDDAGDALTTCAGRVEQAQAAGRRAGRLQAAAPTLGAGPWAAGLDRSSVAAGLLAESAALEQLAVNEAVAVLTRLGEVVRSALRPPDPRPLTAAEQVRGVFVGAADSVAATASLAYLATGLRGAYDQEGLDAQERDWAAGLAQLARDPAPSTGILLGTHLWQQGRYGELLGSWAPDVVLGLATGGLVPALRRAATAPATLALAGKEAGGLLASRAPAIEALATPRPEAGGAVVPQPGALVIGRSAGTVADLSPEHRATVLADARRSPALPAHWTADQTVAAVMHTATHPLTSVVDGSGTVHEGRVDDVTVRVSVGAAGAVTGVELLRDPHAEH